MAIPAPARILGWAGVLPFAAGTAGTLAGWPDGPTTRFALLAYGAAILSFMAGCQWGLTVRAPHGSDQRWRGYAVSVIPALLAWLALLWGGRTGLLLLAITFAALLAYDIWTVRVAEAPPWYGRLRTELTLPVVILLAAAAVA